MVRPLLVVVPMRSRARPAFLAWLIVVGCDPDEDRASAPGSPPAPATPEVAPQPALPPEPTTTATPAPPAVTRRRAWPPTALPLGLLATMESSAAERSRATIRDEDSGVIASYRPGDRIRQGVEVLGIEDGVVELSNEGEIEYLSVSEIPVELSADDVFYPDLVDDLQLSGDMGDGMPLSPSPEYTIKAKAFAWGTPRTLALLRDSIREYARGRDVPRVHIGDISRKGGGPFPPHLSHQEGRDVDIAYVLHNRRARFGVANDRTLDRRNTWALLDTLLDTRAITYVFVDYEIQRLLYEHAQAEGVDETTLERLFQYPYGRRAARGVIRHWRGHRDHFHVRFDR